MNTPIKTAANNLALWRTKAITQTISRRFYDSEYWSKGGKISGSRCTKGSSKIYIQDVIIKTNEDYSHRIDH